MIARMPGADQGKLLDAEGAQALELSGKGK